MDMMEDESGDSAVALDALKSIRDVLRQAMAKLPQSSEESVEDDIPVEASPEQSVMEEIEEAPAEEAPMIEKKTVLSSFTPKYGGDSKPPMDPPKAALRAKKKQGY